MTECSGCLWLVPARDMTGMLSSLGGQPCSAQGEGRGSSQEEGSWNRRKSKEVAEYRHIYVFFYSLSIYKVLVIRGRIAMIIHSFS